MLSCLFPYTLLYIYTTARSTSFAKVKVIVKAEVTIAAVRHVCFFFDAKLRQKFHSAKKYARIFSF